MSLIKCHECNKEISDSAASCPGCGAPINSPQPEKGDVVPYTDQEVSVMLTKKKNTNHILHLLLSIITVGIWSIVWILMALGNSMENGSIDAKIKKGKKVK